MERRHDVVVVGGSAGALGPLKLLAENLPADFPASLHVVLHGPIDHDSQVPAILRARAKLPVVVPKDGEHIHNGRIYVAPSDRHMMLSDGHILLRRGPTENGFRPAIDPLFRSAAASASSRVVGLVLSGTLDDGAAGLSAIRRCGGLCIVQDPLDADYSDMPRAADAAAKADHVVAAADMADLLGRLVRLPAEPACETPSDIRTEILIAALEEATMTSENAIGELSPFSCPDCNGNLWEVSDQAVIRYRCHTGHAYTANTLLEMQSQNLERRLYEVLRNQRERASLLRRMASAQQGRSRESFEKRARLYEDDAVVVENVLKSGGFDHERGSEPI